MSKILNFIFSHYVGLFFAGVVFVSTGAQAQAFEALNVASVENPESQPSTTPSTPTPAPIAPASETPRQAQPTAISIKHLSKKEAQIIRDLHRHGIYW